MRVRERERERESEETKMERNLQITNDESIRVSSFDGRGPYLDFARENVCAATQSSLITIFNDISRSPRREDAGNFAI